MATYHVRPRPANGNPDEWAVEKRGASRASSVHNRKAGALGAARSTADEGDTLVIHNANGGVMKRNTIGQQKSVRDKMGKGFGL